MIFEGSEHWRIGGYYSIIFLRSITICYFFQALIFAIVSSISGYDPSLGINQTETAKLGLKIQMSLIPFVLITIGMIIFYVGYKISRFDAIENRAKLLELKL